MINYTEKFFDLKLLKLSDIKLHEATENNRLRNIYGRIAKDKFLMNPIIVAKYDSDYILIDGANRFSSLKEIGCKMVLAQIIDYKDKRIKLDHWNHLIYDFDIDLLKKHYDKNGIKYRGVKHAEASKALKNRLNHIIASDLNKDESILVNLPGKFDVFVNGLFDLTKLYFHKYSFDRSETNIRLSDLKKYSRRKGTLIEYPNFQKEHVVKIAKAGLRIPAGITRHILINRVLHVRYELKNLMDDKDIEEKTARLQKYLTKKIDDNKVRQYTESVIVFDE
jgi:hypothetical protein